MEYFSHFPIEFDRLLNVLSSVFGILGFLFGIWRYLKERQAQSALSDRERQLTETLSRLDHLRSIAKGLDEQTLAVRS